MIHSILRTHALGKKLAVLVSIVIYHELVYSLSVSFHLPSGETDGVRIPCHCPIPKNIKDGCLMSPLIALFEWLALVNFNW